MSTDVGQQILRSVASTLRGASSDLDGAASSPEAPEAGAATGAVAALMTFLADQAASISEGIGGAGDAVADGGQSYATTDHGEARNFN